MIIVYNSETEALEAVRKITVIGAFIYVYSGIHVEDADTQQLLTDYTKITIDSEFNLFYESKLIKNPVAYGVDLNGNLNKNAITSVWDTPVLAPTGEYYIKSPYNTFDLPSIKINGQSIDQLFDSFLPTPVQKPQEWMQSEEI